MNAQALNELATFPQIKFTKQTQDGVVRCEPAIIKTLIQTLRDKKYSVVGPTRRDSAIIYDELASADDLPIGWTEEQTNASYKLRQRTDKAYFGYTVGPFSWKKFLFPPALQLVEAKGNLQAMTLRDPVEMPKTKYAFVGVRPCELAALFIQDAIFMHGEYIDPYYKALREQAFIVVVNCTQAGGTCFCASMKTGPRAAHGFDLALTEIVSPDEHYFLAEAGTEKGKDFLAHLTSRPAEQQELATADARIQQTVASMGRSLETDGLKELLYRTLDHPRWEEVGKRCLSCTNCTMVCPTCFCSTMEDTTDLTGTQAERWRKWDSCFTLDFSYIHGGSVRISTKARYRQWMTHKLANWVDQFGTFGCIGCGRCITWCPVGIDLTEEARVIKETEHSSQK